MPHIGQNIRALRILKGMKQASFAQLMGIPQQSVSRLEKQSSASSAKIEKAAEVLEVTVQAIEQLQSITSVQAVTAPQAVQPGRSLDEIMRFIQEEIERRDQLIQILQAEVAARSNNYPI